MKRRGLVFGGVAAAAAVAGAGLALWRARGTPVSAEAEALWSQTFDTPTGGRLAMNALRGRPLLLNFWATWCPPCISELPLLDRFHQEQRGRGWQVAGLAVDKVTPVVEFLNKHPVGFPIGMVGMDGIELGHSLGNVSGALPFTVVFGRSGRVIAKKSGLVGATDLQDWVAANT
jgi:thiol-disulfide isomerase/thioredoxin